MLKGKEVIGRKIMTLDGGERIDSVRDLIFDEQGNRVLALLVDEGGWFHAAKVIAFSSVRSVGEDAVMIGSAEDVVSARDHSTIAAAMESKSGLVGLNLLTTDGKELGRIADVFFDEATGQVVGYEATGGLFSDLSSGRTFVPAPESVTIGAEAAIVPPAVAQAMEEQEAGGLQGAFSSASESVKGAAGTVADSVKGAAGNVAQATRERQKEYVVGKVAGSDVVSDSGVPLVSKGETITAMHAEQAEALGLLGSLTAAAGGGTVQEFYGSARESVQGGVENMATATRERQKEYVVGKVAGSDVVAQDGSLIVTKGETITTVQAGTAEDKGALGNLVAAATSGSVQGGVQGVRDNIAARTQSAPVSLIGRRVQRDVFGPNRSFVAAQGQIVTESLLERARALGKEQELADAVATQTASTGSAISGSASAAMSDASDRLAAGAQNVKDGASGLLDRAKGWLSETRDRANDDVEESRIEGAVGRPVNRVVLDKQDNIILNIGEIITHKAVEQARAGDVLGILLSSVSTETPSIDPMSVRPDEHGQAALDSQPDVKKTDPV